MRIGILGLGRIGAFHAETLSGLDAVDSLVVTDPFAEAAKAAARLPMGKLGQPDEIADFVVFLLSERSGVVTGSVIDWDQNVLGGLD